MSEIIEKQKYEEGLIFTGKHGLDFSKIKILEYSKESIKLLDKERKKYSLKVRSFINKKGINGGRFNNAQNYIELNNLLTKADKNKKNFDKYRNSIIYYIKDVHKFIIENSSKVTQEIEQNKGVIKNFISSNQYGRNMAGPQ